MDERLDSIEATLADLGRRIDVIAGALDTLIQSTGADAAVHARADAERLDAVFTSFTRELTEQIDRVSEVGFVVVDGLAHRERKLQDQLVDTFAQAMREALSDLPAGPRRRLMDRVGKRLEATQPIPPAAMRRPDAHAGADWASAATSTAAAAPLPASVPSPPVAPDPVPDDVELDEGAREQLLAIPGLGPARVDTLLANFGSLDAIVNAGVDEVAAIKGISDKLARYVVEALTA